MLVQLRREKVELENALEQEQESLVNRLWKRMDKLETEKRLAFIIFISNYYAKQERYSRKCVVDQNNLNDSPLGSLSIISSQTAFSSLKKKRISCFSMISYSFISWGFDLTTRILEQVF